MSIPDNPGPDDEIFASMRDQLKDVSISDDKIINVTNLSDSALGRTLHRVRQALLDRQEMMNPTTDRGRELHSLRTALIIEINNRFKRRH